MIKVNTKLVILVSLFCMLTVCSGAVAAKERWQELKKQYFLVYFTKDKKFARKVLDKAEKYYKKIADDLGYARYSNFWQWERRVKIYIYPDQKSYKGYLKKNNRVDWATGVADYKKKEIVSYAQSKNFVDAVLPHEITHLIFRDYIGLENIPIWIDEGIAQWEEKGRYPAVKKKIKETIEIHSLIPLKRMMTLNINSISTPSIIELYYLQAVSLIGFLIEQYGADNFIFFCRQLRDGKDMNEALRFSYPTSIRDVDMLEEKWKQYVENG